MLLNDETLERATTAQVGRGLHVLRYVSGAVSGPSPVAIVRPAAGCESSILVVSAPGAAPGSLSHPGDCLVVRAERSGELSIRLIRPDVHVSFEASFRLELLFAGEAVSAAARPSADTAPSEEIETGAGLRLCAHVARRGDVVVPAAQWVAGPGAPAAIEGVEIRGSLPAGLGIEMQALAPTNPPRWLDWSPTGSLAGTRGRAMPLIGLRIRLVGPSADRFQIKADALFLGSAIITREGREVELIGSGGVDPLVGLRLGLSPRGFSSAEAFNPVCHASTENVAREQRVESRVKVFRAQARV
jgi:hypothetical protein